MLENVGYAGKEISKMIPFGGDAIIAIERIIESIYGNYKRRTFKDKVRAINNIIKKKITLEDDLSLKIGKAAIQITYARETKINSMIQQETVPEKKDPIISITHKMKKLII